MGRGKAKAKEGLCWVAEPLKDLQERVGSCAEEGDHVGPWQWVAVGHLEVH